ncbi:hypothetical protein SPRG_08008 [Saprolegnia parasitica CBS 223.65]|uniref:Uncharacterized protein n=1 Tax=Saprolegnia parasitica (strain CBS 223.65) TaxID=695850 RepID=A0A067C761_SAPPC|nr:hypothetical protein SPRG_08008 [Saprolegnia parasitica CBS 223.65]KDO26604.1 hypothetical protein SPRG_08008 [Saprolegnia parasitica CBS 223.65]|eukprot:XP_012202746.1 hypothetical protein SPRG_08008 [Saprolegnia parasitica CBS 223.65]
MGLVDDDAAIAWLDASIPTDDVDDDACASDEDCSAICKLRRLEAERLAIEQDNVQLLATLAKFADPKATTRIAHENNAMKRDLAKLATTFTSISAIETRQRPAKQGGWVESFNIGIETLEGRLFTQWYDYGVIIKLAVGLRGLHPTHAHRIPPLPSPATRLQLVHAFFAAVSTMPGLKWKIRAPDSGTYSSVPCTAACLETNCLRLSSSSLPMFGVPDTAPVAPRKKHNRYKWWRRATS